MVWVKPTVVFRLACESAERLSEDGRSALLRSSLASIFEMRPRTLVWIALRAEAQTAAVAAAAEALVAGATTVTCPAQRAFFGVALQKAAMVGGKFKVDRDGFRWRGGLDLQPPPWSASRAQADDDRAGERVSDEAAEGVDVADEEDEESPWAVRGGEEGCSDVREEDAREARGMPWLCKQVSLAREPPWVGFVKQDNKTG